MERNGSAYRAGDAARDARPTPQSSIPRKRPAETQEDAWVADEDRFVLQQAKKKATLRVRAGRAKPIDYLAVTLRTVEPAKNGFEDDDDENDEPLVVNPEAVFEGMQEDDLAELEKGIDTYLALEKSKTNHDFWQTMKVVCKDRRQASEGRDRSARGLSSVAPELDRVLGPKNLKELEALEKQVKHKLRTDDSIDVDYWENLLKRLAVHKARAQLRKVSQDIVGSRLAQLRKQQASDAARLRTQVNDTIASQPGTIPALDESTLNAEPLLKIAQSDKSLVTHDEATFRAEILRKRQQIVQAGFVPLKSGSKQGEQALTTLTPGDTSSKPTNAAYDREVAKGIDENEEIFAVEEDVSSARKPIWADKYRPRKPRYFNRVQMGYEWNKYNQTHYDQDNPPPKVVQGYKFNIFYPDLVDNTKAPTYRIERENGRKRGQSFAPAGEDDACLIRFIAGAPYEDVAFRIVDREWDYSAKRERGFKSSFDKVSPLVEDAYHAFSSIRTLLTSEITGYTTTALPVQKGEFSCSLALCTVTDLSSRYTTVNRCLSPILDIDVAALSSSFELKRTIRQSNYHDLWTMRCT